MVLILFLLFTVLPVVELALLIRVGSVIGGLNTVLLVLTTGALGAALARWQGVRTLRSIQRQLAEGQMPTAALLDGALILLAGALLVTPGVITDGAGLALLLPPVRALVRRGLRRWAEVRVQVQQDFVQRGFPQGPFPQGPFPQGPFPQGGPDYGGEEVRDVEAEVRDVEAQVRDPS